jgi:hypothetical protein
MRAALSALFGFVLGLTAGVAVKIEFTSRVRDPTLFAGVGCFLLMVADRIPGGQRGQRPLLSAV